MEQFLELVNALCTWLRKEVIGFELAKRRFTVRYHHALLIAGAGIAAVVLVAAGVFAGHYLYPYKTLPKPPLPPGQAVPDCSSESPQQHTPGACLPQPKIELRASITASSQGPDLSNNDPVYGSSAWHAIAGRNSFAIFKVTEGTGYVDRTAAPMAASAKAQGLAVGGYDFLHVCGTVAVAEAQQFALHLRADGLTGAGTLPPFADAEYGGSGCNARSWLQQWVDEAYRQTGRHPWVYTGAWWWQPHVGAYWPSFAGAWISGYGVRYPYMPSGRTHLDIWQFTDHGFNGVSSVDLSTWRDGVAAFTAATLGKPVTPPDTHLYNLFLLAHDERTLAQTYDRERPDWQKYHPQLVVARWRMAWLAQLIDYRIHHSTAAVNYRWHRYGRRSQLWQRGHYARICLSWKACL